MPILEGEYIDASRVLKRQAGCCCLRGERVRHEEDDIESQKLKPARKRAAIDKGRCRAR
jgi:hypothetical protein